MLGGFPLADASAFSVLLRKPRVEVVSSSASIVEGLVHRWPLTANGNDVVGALHLSASGTVTYSSNGAATSSGYLTTATGYTPPSAVTMCVWVKPLSGSGNESIIGQYAGLHIATELGAKWIAYGSTGKFFYGASVGSRPYSSHKLLMLVVDGANATLYDGTNAGGTSSTFGTSAFNMAIGGGSYSNFAGHCLDARIYERALSSAEISALVSAGPNP